MEFGTIAGAGTENYIMARGVLGATITATNQTHPAANVNNLAASGLAGNFYVNFRNQR
jgi:hypothetical protein